MYYPLNNGYMIYINGRERAGSKYSKNIFIKFIYKIQLIYQ